VDKATTLWKADYDAIN
jgi:sec1 family domain-containing protein 1